MRTHYFMELKSVRSNVVQMGDTTILLFDRALRAVVEPNPAPSAKAGDLKAETDR
jgi:hypothetical protein